MERGNLQDDNSFSRKSLGELLVEEKLITPEQLDNAIKIQQMQGGRLSEILVNQGVVKDKDLAAILSVKLNIPLIDLQRHKIQPEALRLIPEDTARKHTLIPLDVVGNSLVVVMADPQDIQTIEDIKAQVKMNIEAALGISTDILRAIDLNYRSVAEIEKQVKEFAPSKAEELTVVTPELVARTPISQTLELLLTQAVRDRASDIHIEPQEDRLRIRFRIDGILHDVLSLPKGAHVPLVSRIKVLADMNIAEQRRPQDGQFSVNVAGRDIDIRTASISTIYGEKVTLRILDKALSLFTLPQLGLLPDSLKKFQRMMKSPFGLVLVGGPTGSGKTTTLYALINSLNRTESNIMTVEDPVEYHFADINQTKVNPKAGITFANGLRSIMRHDPDVILVGEIRDNETATIAVQAALTGHLVLSSVHANDSVGVLFRMVDLGIERYLLASTLIGISTQRMIRRLCPHCLSPYEPSPEELALYDEELSERPQKFYGSGIGCNLCGNIGYQGRTGIFETLLMSEEIRRMLLTNVSAVDIKAQALREGMVTMKHDGMLKVKQGITTVNEVMRSVFSIG
ncbi:MAG: type II/IV secretion system protein [Dehalococcoidales bacterium]|nr:type II/IV secretion system protein [Dehalococcoidales bacterium]